MNKKDIEMVKILENDYENKWGKKVNYSIIPKGIVQEDMVAVLRIMIKTGDSLLVAFEKFKKLKIE